MDACGRAMIDHFVYVEIEEKLVFANRAANRAAKIVISQERPVLRSRGEVVGFGVQPVSAEILIGCAVPPIRAALGDLVENRSANAVLRREGRGTDLQLRNGFERRDIHVGANRQVGRGAVLKKVVIKGEVPVDRNRNPGISGFA